MEKLKAELASRETKEPLKTGDLPEAAYAPFKAMAQGRVDFEVDAIYVNTNDYGPLMALAGTEECIYVTREQAKRFFGFKD